MNRLDVLVIVVQGQALRVGKGKALDWDAPNIKFSNSEEANKWISKEYRKGWEIKIV